MPTKKTITRKANFICYNLVCNISFWQYKDKFYKTYNFCGGVIEIEKSEVISQIVSENLSLVELVKRNKEKIKLLKKGSK